MSDRRTIEAIAEHALAARELAMDADEAFIAQLLELVLHEAGTRLARLDANGAAPGLPLAALPPDNRRRRIAAAPRHFA